MTHGDGGKGSGRRNEDLNKVNEGFTRVFGLSKFEQRLKKEQEESMMNDEHNDEVDYSEEEWTCDVCGGPMYSAPHWSYGQCDDCGARQELINDDYL